MVSFSGPIAAETVLMNMPVLIREDVVCKRSVFVCCFLKRITVLKRATDTFGDLLSVHFSEHNFNAV